MSAVSGLASAVLGADAQSDAAEAAANAARDTSRTQASVLQGMFDKSVELQSPFREAGLGALEEIQGFDTTAEARPYMERLEGMPGLDLPEFNYSFDENDPGYQFRKKELEKTINQASAARGNYNSRPTINALGEGNLALTADETDRQFSRAKDIYSLDYKEAGDEYSSQYGKLMDLYNMGSRLGLTDYSKLIDLTKIGQGSAASAGSGAIATGQGLASIYGQQGRALQESAIAQGQGLSDMYSNIATNNQNTAMMAMMYGGGGG